MREALRFVLLTATIIAFPWLAISVASNLQTISAPITSSVVNPCAANGCATYPVIVTPLTGQSNGYALQFLLATLVLLFVVVSYYGWRKGVRTEGNSFRSLPSILLIIIIFYIALVSAKSFGVPTFPGVVVNAPAEPSPFYLPLAIVLVVGVISIIWSLRRSGRILPETALHEYEREAAARILRGAIYSLRSGSDSRSIIINCYRSLGEVLQKSGVASTPAMTAREFEAESERLFSIRHEPIHHLTSLFEKARYSDEEVGTNEASEAEAVLSELRSEIVGARGLN
jgi:hypothetical protein